MAFTDIFKARKSAKIHRQAWQAIWERVKTPPADDAPSRELHAVFVGTLLYATRYRAAIVAGMEETIAKTVALQVVAQAGFDDSMRDRVLSVFTADKDGRISTYGEALNPLVAACVARAGNSGGAPGGESTQSLLEKIEGLLPVLADQLADAERG